MTKAEQVRLTAWRLRVLQQAADDGNVARVCRRFGISRKTFYKWKQRHVAHGETGLCDRPRLPLRSPRATARDVVSKILYLRQHYHFGALNKGEGPDGLKPGDPFDRRIRDQIAKCELFVPMLSPPRGVPDACNRRHSESASRTFWELDVL